MCELLFPAKRKSADKYLACIAMMTSLLLVTQNVNGKEYQQVKIADPFIDLRTGPGLSYPKFYVAARGESIDLLLRKTNWYKVRTENGKEGWVSEGQLSTTLNIDGSELNFPTISLYDFRYRRWEMGIGGGSFGGADLVSLYGAHSFTENISTELTLSQALGTFSTNYLYDFSVVHQAFPEWRCSPFFFAGGRKTTN